MSDAELFKKHKIERCSKCNINIDCEIHITQDRKTRCTYDEIQEKESNVFKTFQKV